MSANPGAIQGLWMFLYQQGGYWRISELRKELSVSYVGPNLHAELRNMALRGMVHKKDGPTYGVTKDCKIPRGFTLGELSL